ncbi:MAG: Maf family protein [Ignavibacteriales bacterium]|nr:Maf family protein [Ignavibacteriales bacterium]
MINSDLPIYLASQSPRRRKLLKQLNLEFKSFSVELKEEFLDGEHPVSTVKRLALEKLNLAKLKISKGIIITADTIVVLNHHVLGKPKDKKDAMHILNLLSNKTHIVYTGFAVYNSHSKKTKINFEKTLVKFRRLGRKEIIDYINTGSPMDKAGAYGIQDDFGAVFVEKITGCYYNVVGLPLTKLYKTLKEIV